MALVEKIEDDYDWGLMYCYYCPGCGCCHWWREEKPNYRLEVALNPAIRPRDRKIPCWTWNHDFEKPTVSPSIDVNRDDPSSHCHCFVENGVIRFLSDCYHSLKNQKVPMEDV